MMPFAAEASSKASEFWSVVTDCAWEATLQCMISSVHRRAVQRRTDALICMLGNGNAPLFPHLAPPQPLVATRRFHLFIFHLFLLNSRGSWSLVRLPAYTYSSPGPARSRPLHLSTVRCLDSLPPREACAVDSRHSATLSGFLLVPLLQSALPVLSPPSFRGA